jgi:tRNA(fMet)-specific endonuclease VapC
MALILDADVVIRGEKGDFDLRGWVTAQASEQFEVAAITIAELWHGVERAQGVHRTRREQYLRAVLMAVPVIAYTEETAYYHARIWAEVQRTGKMIGYYDLIVAATALERGSTVATFNKRHFAVVKGLKAIEPSGY